jgi:hypothetical protein
MPSSRPLSVTAAIIAPALLEEPEERLLVIELLIDIWLDCGKLDVNVMDDCVLLLLRLFELLVVEDLAALAGLVFDLLLPPPQPANNRLVASSIHKPFIVNLVVPYCFASVALSVNK